MADPEIGRDSAFGRALDRAARVFALLGGAVFTLLTLLSLYSVGMRNLAGSPIMGDWELVQIGCAVAIAACFPMCQMRGGHIIVDFFTQGVGRVTRKRLDGVGALVLAVMMALLAWRTAAGAVDAKANNETSMIMELPTWLGYALMVPSFGLASIAALYVASRHFRLRDI
ncbi:MAG TPA: TRAP transporter small permease [Lautropia sp.]|nr:TRAP transporter small permease [Lautropia sp.]